MVSPPRERGPHEFSNHWMVTAGLQWNLLGRALEFTMEGVYTNSAGRTTMVNLSNNWFEYPYWIPGDNSGIYYWLKTIMTGPPRRAGEGLLAIDPLDIAEKGRSAWQYLPGQRRVKLAPEIAHDTPDFNMSGVSTSMRILPSTRPSAEARGT